MIAVLVLVGFVFGAQPLVGYNYGAKNFLRLKKILRFCYGFECSLAVVLACVLSLFAPSLISLFMQEEKIIELGIPMLRMQQAGLLLVGFTASHAAGYIGVICSQAIADALTAVLAVVLFWRGLYRELEGEAFVPKNP